MGFNPGAATLPFPAGVRLPVGLTWRTLHTFPHGRHSAPSGLEHTVFPQVRGTFDEAVTARRAVRVTGATSQGPS